MEVVGKISFVLKGRAGAPGESVHEEEAALAIKEGCGLLQVLVGGCSTVRPCPSHHADSVSSVYL